jgi:hypothetical protein
VFFFFFWSKDRPKEQVSATGGSADGANRVVFVDGAVYLSSGVGSSDSKKRYLETTRDD